MRDGVQVLLGDEAPSRDLYWSYAESGRPRYGGSIIEDSRECVDLIDDWNDLLGVGRILSSSDCLLVLCVDVSDAGSCSRLRLFFSWRLLRLGEAPSGMTGRCRGEPGSGEHQAARDFLCSFTVFARFANGFLVGDGGVSTTGDVLAA